MTSSESSATRERLIQVAMDLFHRQGYEGTGVAQILRQAGVRSGSLYYFFASKEHLLAAVLERYRELFAPVVLQPALERSEDPIERIFALLEGYRHMLIQTDCTRGCPIGNLVLEIGDHQPASRERLNELMQLWVQSVRRMLDDAGDRLPADVDRAQLATFVLAVMEGGVMQARAQRKLAPFEASVAQLRDFMNRLQAQAAAQRVQPGKRPHSRRPRVRTVRKRRPK